MHYGKITSFGYYDPYFGCPPSGATYMQELFRREQEKNPNILRGFHGRRYEYVYSETLRAYVRIGEPLKPQKETP